MNIKEQLYLKCEEALQSRLRVIQKNISDLESALQSETKSSAGDKHEIGRAIIQIEREKAGQQLAEIQKSQKLLQRIDDNSKHKKIAIGSIVYTSQFNYFISISVGEINHKEASFYAISPESPIAKLLIGKAEEDSVFFRNTAIKIFKVL